MPKNLYSTELSADEKAAQLWHDSTGHRMTAAADCWCCCKKCRVSNPHEWAARRAALADITYRLRESMKSVRRPQKDEAHR